MYKLEREADYQQWLQQKMELRETDTRVQVVEIADPVRLTPLERMALQQQCNRLNFAIYRLQDPDLGAKTAIRAMAVQLGMQELDTNLCADKDSLSSIQVRDEPLAAGYIPYTNHGLSWHTDGYYNSMHQQIRSFLLHCVRPAVSGGENYLLNHELVYMRLREHSVELALALMHPQAFGVPANTMNGAARAACFGPVFYTDPQSGELHMRYTSRTRSIIWRQDRAVAEAVGVLREIISEQNPHAVRYRLAAGEGVICNNILHARSAFIDDITDSSGRLLYRARSYERLFSRHPSTATHQGNDHVMAQ